MAKKIFLVLAFHLAAVAASAQQAPAVEAGRYYPLAAFGRRADLFAVAGSTAILVKSLSPAGEKTLAYLELRANQDSASRELRGSASEYLCRIHQPGCDGQGTLSTGYLNGIKFSGDVVVMQGDRLEKIEREIAAIEPVVTQNGWIVLRQILDSWRDREDKKKVTALGINEGVDYVFVQASAAP